MQGDSETAWAGPAAAAHDNWVSKEDFHTKFSDLALKFERLETVVEERGEEIKQLNGQLRNAVAQRDRVSEALEDAKTALSENTVIIITLRDQLKERDEEIKQLKLRIAAGDTKLSNTAWFLQHEKTQHSSSQATVSRLNKQIRATDRREKELTEWRAGATKNHKAELDEAKATISRLRGRLTLRPNSTDPVDAAPDAGESIHAGTPPVDPTKASSAVSSTTTSSAVKPPSAVIDLTTGDDVEDNSFMHHSNTSTTHIVDSTETTTIDDTATITSTITATTADVADAPNAATAIIPQIQPTSVPDGATDYMRRIDHEKDEAVAFAELPTKVQDSIRQQYHEYLTCKNTSMSGVDWWEGLKDLKPAPKAMPKCLRYYSRKSGASPWTSEHQGKYACRSCTNKGVACLLYDRATKKIILLPLHPEFRTLKDTTIPTDAGYWVRDPSQDARSSPIYGFTRKRKADGEEGEQPGAKRVISS